MSFEIKTYSDSYLYNNRVTKANEAGANKNNMVLKDYINNCHRVDDKESEAFRGIVEDVKRQQMSSVLYSVLLMEDVKICMYKYELPRAFKVFEARDPYNNRNHSVFIDCTGLLDYKNGYYYCKKVDVLVSYLLEALIYLLYRKQNMKIMNNSTITINATECYVSMFNFVLDYLRIIGYSENKNKISYLIALFFLTNMMSKPLDNYTKSVAATISGIEKKNIAAYDLYLDAGMFDNINEFITNIAKTFKLKGFTTEVFISKWIFRFNIGTQYGSELFTSFASILACTYVGSYIVNQNQVEKCCGTAMVKFINEILKVGSNVFSNPTMRESAIAYKDKGTMELARKVNNKESKIFKSRFRKKDLIMGSQVNPNIRKHLKECNDLGVDDITVSKYVDSVMESALGCMVDYAAFNDTDIYYEGALLETAKILKGNFNNNQINDYIVKLESVANGLRELCQTEELEECTEDKQRISRCVKEIMECYPYIK